MCRSLSYFILIVKIFKPDCVTFCKILFALLRLLLSVRLNTITRQATSLSKSACDNEKKIVAQYKTILAHVNYSISIEGAMQCRVLLSSSGSGPGLSGSLRLSRALSGYLRLGQLNYSVFIAKRTEEQGCCKLIL